MPSTGTPCIGICSAGIGDSVCRGCMRCAHEVSQWNGFSAAERQLVWARLDRFLVQIVNNRLELLDLALLKAALTNWNIPCDPARPPQRWLYDLLRLAGSRIGAPVTCGFGILPGSEDLSAAQLCREIEREWHALSLAHFERYIAPGLGLMQSS
ncbi:MAG: DUF1289 domain-containing protein [Gammaproteobacteria bacterium]